MIKNILSAVRQYLIRRKVRKVAACAASLYEALGGALTAFGPLAEETVIVAGQVAAAAANDPKVEAACVAMVEAFGPHIAALKRRWAATTNSPEMAGVMAAVAATAEKYAVACAAMVAAAMPDAPEQE